jgi:hypothetical protein
MIVLESDILDIQIVSSLEFGVSLTSEKLSSFAVSATGYKNSEQFLFPFHVT